MDRGNNLGPGHGNAGSGLQVRGERRRGGREKTEGEVRGEKREEASKKKRHKYSPHAKEYEGQMRGND